MATTTTINLIDQSQIPQQVEAIVIDDSPIFLAAAATEKGPEEMQLVGDEFFTLYGNPNFKKFGQANIQAADIIASGGRLLFKRIVPDDAKLANIIISAKVSKKQIQKTNEEGLPLYKTESGEETTEASDNTPIMINHALVRYEATSMEDVADIDSVYDAALELLDDTGTAGEGEEASITWFTYPLFVITDNGRGSCGKRVRIYPEYELSKRSGVNFYTLEVLENTAVTEATRFSIETNDEYKGESIELSEVAQTYLKQIKAKSIQDSIDLFKEKIIELSGYDVDELDECMYLVAKTKKKLDMGTVELDTTVGIDFTIENGIGLVNGDSGKFRIGIQTKEAQKEYEDRLVEFFSGEFDDDIFNFDIYRFAACIDAVYPDSVKKKIEELAEYRQDFMFYRDLGLDNRTIYDVESAMENVSKSKYVSVYCTVYDVRDTYSKKQITVTCLYEMASLLVTHLKETPEKIFAGIRYNAILSRAIKGSVRFIPKILPNENQKELMEDLRCNYAYYYNDTLVIDSGWTSQEEYTQLSFTNNMNAVLYVLRELRQFFPQNRFKDMSTTDTELINELTVDINRFLINFSYMFEELNFVYIDDKIAVANKLYKAALYFRFREFEQGEIINAYALPPIV